MPSPTLFIRPSASFWDDAARALLAQVAGGARDLSGLRVAVPAFSHAQLLKQALLRQLGNSFVPPRIVTLAAWCAQLPPEAPLPAAASARLMDLYAELRKHAWLKKIFSARRNTDLLPLAQVLLTLSDELTQCLLPGVQQQPESGLQRWHKALAQLSPAAQRVVSDEAQLVWSIWQAQLDGSDPLAYRYRQLMQLAAQADLPLVWIGSAAPEAFDRAFLDAYSLRQPVQSILPDWRAPSVAPLLRQAWPESAEADPAASFLTSMHEVDHDIAHVRLSPASGLEQEAQRGAQTVVDWLQAGKGAIAVIAQDRVAARRLRALLERAAVFVADETGWKLSTTRAASAVAAWFELVSTRGETLALLDLLKSPFACAGLAEKEHIVMGIEIALRNRNVLGGWEAVGHALVSQPEAQATVRALAQHAAAFAGRKPLAQWSAATEDCLRALGIWQALENDAAGQQVVALLQAIAGECARQQQEFSFAEWRAFVGVQLESTAYIPPELDRRVVMLTLNGAQLRRFDAVLMLGCDAEHLPSQGGESLFFANAVRRELGLATRESQQQSQLRDFAALLCSSDEIVLSWQERRDGEPNPVSAWIARLQLALQRTHRAPLAQHQVEIASRHLKAHLGAMPQPRAAQLMPAKLSAGAYGSLLACPYQFFAGRMLGLSGIEELSDMPEKRDYGDWLHKILYRYHESLREQEVPFERRDALLHAISAQLFDKEVATNAAALGYYVRWQKVMPAYLAWANRREADGWRFVFGERKFEKTLPLAHGDILLHGRIDRVDEGTDGALALLDYKTRNAAALRDKLKQGEDRQLAFYGILSGLEFAEAHYVSLDAQKNKLDAVEARDFAAAQRALERQMTDNLESIAQGAPLPASGIEDVCAFCAVRGLCRKGAW